MDTYADGWTCRGDMVELKTCSGMLCRGDVDTCCQATDYDIIRSPILCTNEETGEEVLKPHVVSRL